MRDALKLVTCNVFERLSIGPISEMNSKCLLQNF